MLDLADARWSSLTSSYRVVYDPRPALGCLASGHRVDAAWAELWEELHHQGDIGTASYAAVCVIADLLASGVLSDWNGYALAATIELQRGGDENPAPPEWLDEAYQTSWTQLSEAALRALSSVYEEPLFGQLVGVLALRRGFTSLGRMALDFDEVERGELLAEAGYG